MSCLSCLEFSCLSGLVQRCPTELSQHQLGSAHGLLAAADGDALGAHVLHELRRLRLEARHRRGAVGQQLKLGGLALPDLADDVAERVVDAVRHGLAAHDDGVVRPELLDEPGVQRRRGVVLLHDLRPDGRIHLREHVLALEHVADLLARRVDPLVQSGEHLVLHAVPGRAQDAVLRPDEQLEAPAGLQSLGIELGVLQLALVHRRPLAGLDVRRADRGERRRGISLGVAPEDAVRDVRALVRVQSHVHARDGRAGAAHQSGDARRVLIRAGHGQRAAAVEVLLGVDDQQRHLPRHPAPPPPAQG
mmetsp:Transcript_18236/g.55704  ORF Transcript_18236/g.55704 Transcript_18236/m.55704 type:complete len:305 (+) Transcript_18236:19-933(+)